MIIIIAAAGTTEVEVNEIAEKYDRARNPNERERITEEAYELLGIKIKGMIGNVSRGWRIGKDEIDALTWEGLHSALENAGVSKIKRSDGVWETFIERCRNSNPVGMRIWQMLTPDLRKTLESAFYLKATDAESLVKELNNILRRRDFYDPTAWAGVSLPSEAKKFLETGVGILTNTELTRLNTLLLSAACPEISVSNQPPPRSLIGYISKFWLPSVKSRIAEMAGAEPMSEYMVEARNALRPVIEEIRQMEAAGTLPPEFAPLGEAERVYQRQKQRLQERYGRAIQWFNERIKKIQPRNPFVVNSPASFTDAKRLLIEHEIPDRLWKDKSALFYLPKSALEPFGLDTIQRVLGLGTADRRPKNQPALPSQPSNADVPAMNLLKGGHQAPAYRFLVDRLYNDSQIEHAVGLFLAENPKPSQAQVEQFQESLSDDLAEDLESVGWDQLTYQIDASVLDIVRDPQARMEILHALTTEPGQILAMTDAIRRVIFARRNVLLFKGAKINKDFRKSVAS